MCDNKRMSSNISVAWPFGIMCVSDRRLVGLLSGTIRTNRSTKMTIFGCADAHGVIVYNGIGMDDEGLDYAFDFFFAAHRAFINADNFFLAAALIGGRVLAFLGADFPFHFAHRCFIASEMRLRAAGLIRRRFPPVDVAFGGRPRRGAVEASTSSAEMAWSRRLRSAFKSETRFWMSIEPPQMLRHRTL
jgi:hypothetical protein